MVLMNNIGRVKSCGCLINHNLKHGMYKTKLYNVWYGIKRRCLHKNDPHYENYGARGISVCDEWKDDFLAFYNWAIENGYDENKKLSIDRINVNGNYEPNNCRWVTMKTQQNNRRNNHRITYKGETKTLQQWAEHFNFNSRTLCIIFKNLNLSPEVILGALKTENSDTNRNGG